MEIRGPTRISSTYTRTEGFRAVVHIESVAADGVTVRRHRYTTNPVTNMSELTGVMHRAGNEARRLDVEQVCRSVQPVCTLLDTSLNVQDGRSGQGGRYGRPCSGSEWIPRVHHEHRGSPGEYRCEGYRHIADGPGFRTTTG